MERLLKESDPLTPVPRTLLNTSAVPVPPSIVLPIVPPCQVKVSSPAPRVTAPLIEPVEARVMLSMPEPVAAL